jgi:hypothetical protein
MHVRVTIRIAPDRAGTRILTRFRGPSMTDDLDNSAPFNDEQGTRVSKDSTGAGAEATQHVNGQPKERTEEHESAYGGRGGEPKESNDIPTSRR